MSGSWADHSGAAPGTALLRAAHLGPTVAVTAVSGLLALGAELAPSSVMLVVLAVLTGQLTIGWSNDLVDARRDRQTGRGDKPLATGELSEGIVRKALAGAALASVGLSLALGWWAALCHLGLCVGGGLAYNLGLKSTAWSWLPYAVAFGALPAVVTLTEVPPTLPSWPVVAAGALLGVGAHFVNVLPDLADDAATGVHGLPHRLGGPRARVAATALLVLASAVIVLGPPGAPGVVGWAALAASVALGAVALLGKGRAPFRAAIGIAVVNVVLLTLTGRTPA